MTVAQEQELARRITRLVQHLNAGVLVRAQYTRLVAHTLTEYALPVQAAPFKLQSWRDEDFNEDKTER